jgi:hypothetical protein
LPIPSAAESDGVAMERDVIAEIVEIYGELVAGAYAIVFL